MDEVQELFKAAKKHWLKRANTSDGAQASKPGGSEKHPNTTYHVLSHSISISLSPQDGRKTQKKTIHKGSNEHEGKKGEETPPNKAEQLTNQHKQLP